MNRTTHDAGPSRDAARTQKALLRAARHRFAIDGYAETTVRSIAADAGVNVALIGRYFGSKEGLFARCLAREMPPLQTAGHGAASLDDLADSMIDFLTTDTGADDLLQLLLLLRTSGDERADAMRRDALATFSREVAKAAGHDPDAPQRRGLLGAQTALGAVLGILMMRTSTPIQPLASADRQILRSVLRAPLTSMLGAEERPRHP
ncbi:TetR family transcriptional regulator [Microbacterium sp. NPDC089318]